MARNNYAKIVRDEISKALEMGHTDVHIVRCLAILLKKDKDIYKGLCKQLKCIVSKEDVNKIVRELNKVADEYNSKYSSRGHSQAHKGEVISKGNNNIINFPNKP